MLLLFSLRPPPSLLLLQIQVRREGAGATPLQLPLPVLNTPLVLYEPLYLDTVDVSLSCSKMQGRPAIIVHLIHTDTL